MRHETRDSAFGTAATVSRTVVDAVAPETFNGKRIEDLKLVLVLVQSLKN